MTKMHRQLHVYLFLVSCLVAPACEDTTTCTLAGCEHSAVVTYPAGLVSTPHDLTLSFAGAETRTARCSDPGAPELTDNTVGVTCSESGFELEGQIATEHAVLVTIVETDTGDVLVDSVEVRLDVTDENHPNGPDCGPTCFNRNGQLVLQSPG